MSKFMDLHIYIYIIYFNDDIISYVYIYLFIFFISPIHFTFFFVHDQVNPARHLHEKPVCIYIQILSIVRVSYPVQTIHAKPGIFHSNKIIIFSFHFRQFYFYRRFIVLSLHFFFFELLANELFFISQLRSSARTTAAAPSASRPGVDQKINSGLEIVVRAGAIYFFRG